MSNCTVCGRQKSGNLDPFRCVRCVNEKLAWEDAQNWLPLARTRIDAMEAEITALRAALDQERADNAKLRAFAQWALDRIPDAVIDEMHRHRLIDINGEPTALLSGRGEGT